jgi:hypothetical protein
LDLTHHNTMKFRKWYLLLPLVLLLHGCGEKFDYRERYAGTFDFTYHYYQRSVFGITEEDRVFRTDILVDTRDEKIQFKWGTHFFRLIVDKKGALFTIDKFGLADEKVGMYSTDEDRIYFFGQKLPLEQFEYLISAERVE